MTEPARRGIYIASRASIPERSALWRRYRDEWGVDITCSWIDQAGENETEDFETLWNNIMVEINYSAALLFYAESDDFPLKGALVEVGAALMARIPVHVVLPDVFLEGRTFKPVGSWISHPLVKRHDHLFPVLSEFRK